MTRDEVVAHVGRRILGWPSENDDFSLADWMAPVGTSVDKDAVAWRDGGPLRNWGF